MTKTKEFTASWMNLGPRRRDQFVKLFESFGGQLVRTKERPGFGKREIFTDLIFAIPAARYNSAVDAWAKATARKPVTDKRHKAAPVKRVTAIRHALAVERFPTITCANCGEQFLGRRSDAATCSPKCRTALYRKRRAA